MGAPSPSRDVLPASAGMIRVVVLWLQTVNGAPRIRGDDPALADAKVSLAQCSPHPRG